MKKIPTLFKRSEDRKHVIPEYAVDLPADAVATFKWDGSAVMFDGWNWWKRREVKPGQAHPADYMEVDFDQTTGKCVGWVPITGHPEDQWFRVAIDSSEVSGPGTFEAVGPHFQGNPHGLDWDQLKAHGALKVNTPIDFDGLRSLLSDPDFTGEGIVWWVDGIPVAKIKRRDFTYSEVSA